jgi:hypothetical protein
VVAVKCKVKTYVETKLLQNAWGPCPIWAFEVPYW